MNTGKNYIIRNHEAQILQLAAIEVKNFIDPGMFALNSKLNKPKAETIYISSVELAYKGTTV